MTHTSLSLLERLRSRSDQAAWDRFVAVYGPLLYGWMRRYHLQHQDACDISQDVLLTVVREIGTFRYDPGKGSFRSWLRSVMIHRLQAFWRSRSRQPVPISSGASQERLASLEDPAGELAQRWDEEFAGEVMHRALALLKCDFEPATWQAFWGVVVESRKPQEVAQALGLTRNAVDLAKFRVMRRLRHEMDGMLD